MNDSNPRLRFTVWAILIAVMLGLCAALAFRSFRESQRQTQTEAALPKLAHIEPFQMLDSNGGTVTEKNLLGKIWVAQFFFTECPGPCPAVSQRLAELQSLIAHTRDVMLVSISIDAEHDTPAMLRAYAQQMKADPQRWLFLTGTPAMVQQLVRQDFLIGFQPNAPEQQATQGRFVHSTKVALVDGTGTVRAYYDGLDLETPQRILTDLTAVLQEEHLK